MQDNTDVSWLDAKYPTHNLTDAQLATTMDLAKAAVARAAAASKLSGLRPMPFANPSDTHDAIHAVLGGGCDVDSPEADAVHSAFEASYKRFAAVR